MKPEGKGIEGQDTRATQGVEGHGEDSGAWGGGVRWVWCFPTPTPGGTTFVSILSPLGMEPIQGWDQEGVGRDRTSRALLPCSLGT